MSTLSVKSKVIFLGLILIITVGITTIVLITSGSSVEKRLKKQLSLGERYISEMEYEKAVVAYKKAVEINPKNVDANIGLAEAYAGSGDDKKARELLEEALENSISLADGHISEVDIQRLREAVSKYIPYISIQNPTSTSIPSPMPTNTPSPIVRRQNVGGTNRTLF